MIEVEERLAALASRSPAARVELLAPLLLPSVAAALDERARRLED